MERLAGDTGTLLSLARAPYLGDPIGVPVRRACPKGGAVHAKVIWEGAERESSICKYTDDGFVRLAVPESFVGKVHGRIFQVINGIGVST